MPPGSAPARAATMTDRHMRPGERLRARARARQAQDGCNSGERGELELRCAGVSPAVPGSTREGCAERNIREP
jgi:hypothetical protein